jgi:Glycosyl transferase family 2/Methyltransferase domain
VETLKEYFDKAAFKGRQSWLSWSGFRMQQLRWHRSHILPNEKILEFGSGNGSLLASLASVEGLGIDFSSGMIALSKSNYAKNKALQFRVGDIQDTTVDQQYDHIICNHLNEYLTDIQEAFQNLHLAAHPRTRLHITTVNSIWDFPIRFAMKIRAVSPRPRVNWLSHDDLVNLLEISGWEVVRSETFQLFPFEIPIISSVLNGIVARLPFIRNLGATLAIIARPKRKIVLTNPISCSVIVPARNESGNIRAALDRIPVLGNKTEIIFVEGNSKDDTWEVIQREVAAYDGPHLVKAMKQPGKGKWDAVFTGFSVATGQVLVIQDADLTAPPEDLPKFFNTIISGDTEFANGSRLVYPMEKQAMRFLNYLGNKFFASALSFILGQTVKDSLCGTKMILKSDYERLLIRIAPFGNFDPFGDFNLLFGSSLLNLKIRDIPIRYKDRTYGETNISRFRHGFILLKMTWFGLINLKLRLS